MVFSLFLTCRRIIWVLYSEAQRHNKTTILCWSNLQILSICFSEFIAILLLMPGMTFILRKLILSELRPLQFLLYHKKSCTLDSTHIHVDNSVALNSIFTLFRGKNQNLLSTIFHLSFSKNIPSFIKTLCCLIS